MNEYIVNCPCCGEQLKISIDSSGNATAFLLDKNKSGIVYKENDDFNNIIVFFEKEFISVNCKRVKLELKAEELYPEGYDLNQIFVSFKERKLQHDIERGSKKAIKDIKKGKM